MPSQGAAGRLVAVSPPSAAVRIEPGPDAAPASPPGRTFRLRVVVSVDAPLTADVAVRMRQIVSDTIALDTGVGDAVTIASTRPTAAGEVRAETSPISATAHRPSPLADGARRMAGPLLSLIGFLLLLFAAAWALARRNTPQRSMTPEERGDYVRRLSELVSKEGSHANPRV